MISSVSAGDVEGNGVDDGFASRYVQDAVDDALDTTKDDDATVEAFELGKMEEAAVEDPFGNSVKGVSVVLGVKVGVGEADLIKALIVFPMKTK